MLSFVITRGEINAFAYYTLSDWLSGGGRETPQDKLPQNAINSLYGQFWGI
jgi:hypothetical protein